MASAAGADSTVHPLSSEAQGSETEHEQRPTMCPPIPADRCRWLCTQGCKIRRNDFGDQGAGRDADWLHVNAEDRALTPLKSQILQMMAQGLNNKTMARELAISVRTVETHRLNIRRKPDIEKPADLMRQAMQYSRQPCHLYND